MIMKNYKMERVKDLLYKLLIKFEDWIKVAKKKLDKDIIVSDRDPVLDNWALFVKTTKRRKNEIRNYKYYQRYHDVNLDHNQNL